jgi:hypothetical protein
VFAPQADYKLETYLAVDVPTVVVAIFPGVPNAPALPPAYAYTPF